MMAKKEEIGIENYCQDRLFLSIFTIGKSALQTCKSSEQHLEIVFERNSQTQFFWSSRIQTRCEHNPHASIHTLAPFKLKTRKTKTQTTNKLCFLLHKQLCKLKSHQAHTVVAMADPPDLNPKPKKPNSSYIITQIAMQRNPHPFTI